jgi:hypothetical protein
MKYKVIATLTLGPGTKLGLSKEQAAARAHALDSAGKRTYLTKEPVQFKAGEEIVFEGELPKHAVELVESPDGAPADKPAAPASADPAQAALPGAEQA